MRWDIWESAKIDQATGGNSQLDPILDVLKWIWECQHSYIEEQLNFWVLLWLLTDGGKVLSQHLACRFLLVWHWESVLHPPTCLPTPTQLKIGHWIREDHNVSKHQKWIEAYACILQYVAEASIGQNWTAEGQSMTPEVSKLVDTFLAVTGMCMPPCIVRECLPTAPEEIPQQDLQRVCGTIIKCMDEVATCQLLLTAWDMFTFLAAEEEH